MTADRVIHSSEGVIHNRVGHGMDPGVSPPIGGGHTYPPGVSGILDTGDGANVHPVTKAAETPRRYPKRPASPGVATRCPTCRRVVIVVEDDEAGLSVGVLDPYRLTAAGEYAALCAGRTTWQHTGYTALTFRRRHAWHIGPRYTADDLDIFPSHECGTPVPNEWKR